MSAYRPVSDVLKAQPVTEGAGVHLQRVFGHAELSRFDPFLLLDDFRGDDPALYERGFPMHPHRGIETITYMLEGTVDHRDSLGNTGTIGPGEVQWMTAGGGILHEEMPHGDEAGRMYGFQLWANLPAQDKMMPPRYREVLATDIPQVRTDTGGLVRVVAGSFAGISGPVRDILTAPSYLDVTLPPRVEFEHPVEPGDTVFAYVFAGDAVFGVERQERVGNRSLVSFGRGPEGKILIRAEANGVRFLLISGRPLDEPVAWGGPIVMNSREELAQAFRELEEGTFIRR